MDFKAGFKTTEFWMSLLTSVGSIAAAVAGVLPDKWAAILTTVSTVAYTVSRGLAKKQ